MIVLLQALLFGAYGLLATLDPSLIPSLVTMAVTTAVVEAYVVACCYVS